MRTETFPRSSRPARRPAAAALCGLTLTLAGLPGLAGCDAPQDGPVERVEGENPQEPPADFTPPGR